MDICLFEKLVASISPTKQMEEYYKDALNSRLTSDKLFVLKTGNIVPVDQASIHKDTAYDAGVGFDALMKDGTIRMTITGGDFLVSGVMPANRRQISKLRSLYVEYKPKVLYLDMHIDTPGQRPSFYSDIKSVEHLDYLLTYGKDDE